MGGEVAVAHEWTHEDDVPFKPADPRRPGGAEHTSAWVTALNDLYRSTPALHRGDCDPGGFVWLVGDDWRNSVCAFLRTDPDGSSPAVAVVANFTPVVREGYEIGVPSSGGWTEVLNGDDVAFGGSGVTNPTVTGHASPLHGQPGRISLRLPPLAVVVLAPDPTASEPSGGS
jgi:1,4-alpha-glucan branching enzyme